MSEKSLSKTEDSENSIRYTNLYESDGKVYTRKVSGFYQSIRRYTGLPLLLGFLILPWLIIDGRPAVYFDLPQRQFYVFWVTFGPQDGMLLGWLLIISAFALFTVTALLGRVWCGFTCPQTVWTLMFIWAESFCEGDRNKRIKLDASEWNFEKTWRKGSKFLIWFLIAFITGATFVGYFYPIRDLLLNFIPLVNENGFLEIQFNGHVVFWTLFFTFMTYMNAGFLREQVCKYMCPYARFQSVMYDQDTLAVHYDSARGEPRGAHKISETKADDKGDCVDCSWCVQVCPVDIDIRDGLQYECINCGLCVDACNTVMDKVGLDRGLIRFTSEDQLENGETHFVRPRVFGYMGIFLVMVGLFVFTVAKRDPVTVDVNRDRGARMYRLQGENIQNVYTIKVHNMDRQEHIFDLQVESIDGSAEFTIKRYKPVPIEKNEIYNIPVRVETKLSDLKDVKTTIIFTLTAVEDESIVAREETTFIAPQH
jgi:cytochrome c oxidase accessory protein FixG